ncbi:venom acid phosphatase Acph-1-like [Microplitis mediator]|uniref:venom acid phosphatase Acph-1-like n=1 Tax=Microplitis mediator TaxID=375433 RepID=UPI0025563CB6|nr:venom acid phosphatase Acph-1-like [Microplitis mediator]
MVSEVKWSLLMFICGIIENYCHAELKMIQVTMRHGDRYPSVKRYALMFYPNDPYFNNTWAPDGPMQLTDKGKLNAYHMGQFLHDRYKELIGATNNTDSVYFRALQYERTVNTARLVAKGLFQINWNSSSESVPVSIDSKPTDEDYLYYAKKMCENYYTDRKNSDTQVERVLSALTDVQKFYDYLSVHTGVNHTRAFQSYLLYGQLVSETSLGLQLEPWTDSIFPSGKLLDLSAVEYIIQTHTPRMKRLLGGVWIKTFLNHVDDLLSGKSTRKNGYFYVYSEHHVAAILNALGIYRPHVPTYLSSVIFELHEIDNNFYVKVIHKNEEKITEALIPGCETSLCLLDTFKFVLKDVILEDFEKDCGTHGRFPDL